MFIKLKKRAVGSLATNTHKHRGFFKKQNTQVIFEKKHTNKHKNYNISWILLILLYNYK